MYLKKHINSLKSQKGVFFFSLFKYLEIVVTALTTFILASKMGPIEMGEAMPVLLYITYANYLSLGLNQVIIKNHSRLSREDLSKLLVFNVQFLTLISFVNLLLAYFILTPSYSFYASMVSIGIMLRSFFMAYFRAVDKYAVLNINNLTFALLLLFSTVFFVTDLSDYLIYWSIVVWISIILYFLSEQSYFSTLLQKLSSPSHRSKVLHYLKEGMRLGMVSFVGTFFLTADRLIIDNLNISMGSKGSYQLADYAGTAYYLICTTIIFYYYPKIIAELRREPKFRIQYILFFKRYLVLMPIVFVSVFFIARPVVGFLFPEYEHLDSFITLSVIAKTSVILLTSIATYYISLDKESVYLKWAGYSIFAVLLFGIVSIYFGLSLVYVPLGVSAILFASFLIKLLSLEKESEVDIGL